MSLYWVGYEVDDPKQDCSALIDRLRKLGAGRVMNSDWMIASSSSAETLRNDLARFLGVNDRIIVAELTSHAAWRNLLLSDVPA
jgi:hypothetical protein